VRKLATVQSVMTPFPHAVDVDAPLRIARQMMQQHGVRHLPVKRGSKLVGVLSDRDLKRSLDPALGISPGNELFVDDVMIHNPYVVETHERLDNALNEMADSHIGSVLVVRKGKLVGIFTATDACRAFCDYLREDHPEPTGDEVA
jgi:acetoin utilization protein AcuB